MRDLRCDICGRVCKKAENLRPLADFAQTEGIADCCHVCEAEIQAHANELSRVANKLTHSWLRRWIVNLRALRRANG